MRLLKTVSADGLVGYLVAIGIGALAGLAAPVVANLSLKNLVMVAGAVGLAGAAAVTGKAVLGLLAGWILAISYDRQYFSFESLVGTWGSGGLYWVPSDAVLLLLFAAWAYTIVVQQRPVTVYGRPLWPIFLPFVLAVLVSALSAGEPWPAIFEFLRVAKLGLALWLLRRTLSPTGWTVAAFALMALIAVQGVIGVAQAVIGDNQGLSLLFGKERAPVSDLEATLGEASHRANGTTSHPNVLASMLIMLLPGAAALALAMPRRWLGWTAIVGTVCGLAGLLATQSRSPIALTALALMMLAGAMILLRLLDIRRAIVGLAVVSIAVGSAAYWQRERIERRLFSDLKASIDLRGRYNVVAIDAWEDAPILGIGANNFRYRLSRDAPDLAQMHATADTDQQQFPVRAFAPVHNFYLLILSETGLVGLSAFLVLVLGTIWRTQAAIRRSSGAVKAMCCGLGIGLLAQAGQQIGDFSLWNDVNLQMFGLIVAMISTAPDKRSA